QGHLPPPPWQESDAVPEKLGHMPATDSCAATTRACAPEKIAVGGWIGGRNRHALQAGDTPASRGAALLAEATPAPGQVAFQEGHLVGEDVAVGKDQVLDPARPEGHGEQRHRRLLRRAPALARVA